MTISAMPVIFGAWFLRRPPGRLYLISGRGESNPRVSVSQSRGGQDEPERLLEVLLVAVSVPRDVVADLGQDGRGLRLAQRERVLWRAQKREGQRPTNGTGWIKRDDLGASERRRPSRRTLYVTHSSGSSCAYFSANPMREMMNP
eukprot:788-Pelagococcus_subviridis.AAC.2